MPWVSVCRVGAGEALREEVRLRTGDRGRVRTESYSSDLLAGTVTLQLSCCCYNRGVGTLFLTVNPLKCSPLRGMTTQWTPHTGALVDEGLVSLFK